MRYSPAVAMGHCNLATIVPGLLLCACVAAPAWMLGRILPVVGGPVFGILFGMALAGLVKKRAIWKAGIGFSSKLVLQAAVVLLGFSLNMSIIMETGRAALPIIVSTISVALALAFILYRALKLNANTAVLVGVGSAICGGSAIAATAPVIGAHDDEVATAISVIFLFNVLAALSFPSLGNAIGLTNDGFALFAGTAVNDTSSVTAAASAWDSMHGSAILGAATVVKLTRTLAIIPISLILALYQARKNKAQKQGSLHLKALFPLFILFFLCAAVFASLVPIPGQLSLGLKALSKYCIIMAMTAIGMNTDFLKLIKTGGKPILLGMCCWLAIAAVSLVMQKILVIW